MNESGRSRYAPPGSRLREIEDSVSSIGFWEYYLELRHGAGAVLRVESLMESDGVTQDSNGFDVTVSWGSQQGTCRVKGLDRAVEVAFQLADAFLEIRTLQGGSIV